MASDNGRSTPSLRVLLARANDAIGAFNDVTDAVNEDARSRDGAAVGHASEASTLAVYAPRARPARRGDSFNPTETDMSTETHLGFEKEFEKMVQKNIEQNQQNNGRTGYVHLAEQVAEAQVKLVEEQVAAAQALLEQTRKDADALLATVRNKDREIAEMTDRIRTLGERVLEANQEFNNSINKGDFK
jgi:hypothetical protein